MGGAVSERLQRSHLLSSCSPRGTQIPGFSSKFSDSDFMITNKVSRLAEICYLEALWLAQLYRILDKLINGQFDLYHVSEVS